jgi:hypothetical protein
VCDNIHLWRVVHSHRQHHTTEVIDTEALARLHRRLKEKGTPRSLWVQTGSAVEMADVDALPVDPWVLGAWLGDGNTKSGALTVGHVDLTDMLALVKERWQGDVGISRGRGSATLQLSKLRDRCTFGHDEFLAATPGHPTRRCAREGEHAGMRAWNVSLSAKLRIAGVLGEKHVPSAYLRAGRQQRIDLLRGLMDTDGWWNATRHRAGFTTTSDRLAADVLELLRTLGIHPLHFSKPYRNKVRPHRTWHVIEFTPTGFNPFSLPRKALPAEVQITALQRQLAKRLIITAVEEIDSVPTQCVAVDAPDSLYLCGEGFIPTHNTGSSPGEWFEARALFQMKFYALVIWRTRGVLPSMLQLVYLGNAEMLRYVPDEQELLATERKAEAVWRAISKARETGDWRPNRSRLCGWCSHQSICPEFGGTPPPLPETGDDEDAQPWYDAASPSGAG